MIHCHAKNFHADTIMHHYLKPLHCREIVLYNWLYSTIDGSHAAMEEEYTRAAKLRKLENFRRQLPYLSCTALEQILNLVQKEGCPELHSRKNIKEAVDLTIDDFFSYGPCVEQLEVTTVTGDIKKIPVLNLPTFLQGVFAEGGYFSQLLLQMHERMPSTFHAPWHGILYADELHPGNQLSSTSRKTWCLYFSWLEMSNKVLTDEKHWFTLMAIRSNEVAEVEAGISQLVRKLLEKMFTHEHGSPLAGILLKSGDHTMKLFWTLGLHLQDGASQRQTFANRQDTGSRMCQLCKNVFALNVGQASSADDEKISSKFIFFKDLDICTDQEILGSWERLQVRQRVESKANFKKWQQASGFTFSIEALLMSQTLKSLGLLKPATGYCHDWMHTMCSNGVLCYIMEWVLEALANSGMPKVWETMCQYLQLWVWPGHLPASKSLQKLFNTKKVEAHRKAEKMVMSASEILSTYSILCYFLETCCVLPENQAKKHVYLAWCHVVDILVASLHFLPQPGQLLQAVERAMSLTVKIGWGSSMRPKFHWALHFEQSMHRFGGLPSCWSLERKHKVARRYGSGLCNTTCYEDTLLKELTCDHLAHLKQEVFYKTGAHCVNPHSVSKQLQAHLVNQGIVTAHHTCQTSNTAKLDCGHVCKIGDCVLYKLPNPHHQPFAFGAGHLECLLECGNLTFAIVQALCLVDCNKCKAFAKWKPSPGELHVVELQLLSAAVIFNKGPDGLVTTLLPPHISLAS